MTSSDHWPDPRTHGPQDRGRALNVGRAATQAAIETEEQHKQREVCNRREARTPFQEKNVGRGKKNMSGSDSTS